MRGVVAAHLAGVLPVDGVVGVKPPWNQPQETPCAGRRSATFLFVGSMPIFSAPLQSSYQGSGSPITALAVTPFNVVVTTSPAATAPASAARSAPPVMPETTSIAPGVDGP